MNLAPSELPPTQPKLKLMCVDDEEDILEGLATQLEDHFDVATFASSAQALQRLRDDPRDFALVISDMRMPKMNGAEFLAQARDCAPTTVRMLLTGEADLDSAMHAVNQGFIFRFLTKPCPADVLLDATEQAAVQYRLQTQDKDLLEARLEAMHEQLVRSERMATLSTLAACIGHEINNATTLLGALHGCLSLSQMEGKAVSPDELQQLQRVFENLSVHGHSLMRLGLPDEEKQQVHDLREVVADTVDMLRSSGRCKHIDLILEQPTHAVIAICDPQKISQVLVNLIGNATDAVTERHGRVASAGRVVARIFTNDSGLPCFEVEDNGPGIPQEKQTQIFEPYFTTKAPGYGTGLGLMVVGNIVDSHQGKLSLTSTPEKGTTFRVTLRARDSAAQSPEAHTSRE